MTAMCGEAGVMTDNNNAALRLEFCAPEFFQAPPKKVKTVDVGTGRVYMIFKDRIVAVATEVRQ
jgi:hypothetical protein